MSALSREAAPPPHYNHNMKKGPQNVVLSLFIDGKGMVIPVNVLFVVWRDIEVTAKVIPALHGNDKLTCSRRAFAAKCVESALKPLGVFHRVWGVADWFGH
jgi:hypothetical protein